MATVIEKGQSALVKVTDIKSTGKEIRKQTGTFYQYHIGIESKTGAKDIAEYLSPIPEQDKFFLGVSQYVKCDFLTPKGTPEIQPIDNPPITATFSTGPVHETTRQPKNETNSFSAQISGSSICFATAYAKDLMVAKINANPRMEVNEGTIQEMCAWANIINENIVEKISF